MRSVAIALLFSFSQSLLFGEVNQGDAIDLTKLSVEETIQHLLSTREEHEFELVSQRAQALGIKQQVMLEATFLYHLDRAEYKKITQLAETFEQTKNDFNPNDSIIFTIQEDWLSVIEYGRALAALEKNDTASFKSHIQEAFWLSPNSAKVFALHINQLRTELAIKKIQLEQDRRIQQIDGDETISIAAMLEGKKALVLRFWSPWGPHVDELKPITKLLAEECSKQQIGFASLLIHDDVEATEEALDIIASMKEKSFTYWLSDDQSNALTKLLRISESPTIIVISPLGKILYHGSIQDKRLWPMLKKIGRAE